MLRCNISLSLVDGMARHGGKPHAFTSHYNQCLALQFVREHGVDQFLALHSKLKDISGDKLFYGDELEYGIFKVLGANRLLSFCVVLRCAVAASRSWRW